MSGPATRRALLRALAAASVWTRAGAAPAAANDAPPAAFGQVVPGRSLQFPQDFGAHPSFRTEWWYATGWLEREGATPCGFQFTLFRSRTTQDVANPSRFAPQQLLFAHAALALPERGRIVHAQRAARAGFGLAWAREGDTDAAIGDWSISRTGAAGTSGGDRYAVRAVDRELALHLTLRTTQAPLPQGDAGYSKKGSAPGQASYYYSEPQLRVQGRIEAAGDGAQRRIWPVTGRAWLDHEWSTTILDSAATGWDWIGINLHDGTSLMAFRVRGRDGATLWSHASWADERGDPVARGPSAWRALRTWRSPRTGADYPIESQMTVGRAAIVLQPLLDDQEIDARASTGTVYWEGAVRALYDGREIGRGYLELTGYAAAIRM